MLLVPLFPSMQENDSNILYISLSLSLFLTYFSQRESVCVHPLTFFGLHQPPHGAHFPQNSLQGALTVTHTAGGFWRSRRGYICWKVSVHWLVIVYSNRHTLMGKVCFLAMAPAVFDPFFMDKLTNALNTNNSVSVCPSTTKRLSSATDTISSLFYQHQFFFRKLKLCLLLFSSSNMLGYPTVSLIRFDQILGIVEDSHGFGAGAVLAAAWTVGNGGGHG